MTSILLINGKISSKQFTWNYLQNRKHFVHFLFIFLKSTLSFEQFEKKDEPHSSRFSQMLNPKDLVTSMSWRQRFRRPFNTQYVNESQNTPEICSTEPLLDFFIFVGEIESGNIHFGNIWDLRTVPLTHWRAMTRILVVKEKIFCN